MPIISRTLESVQPTEDGVFASFLAVDALGVEWRKSRMRFADEAEAQTALDAFDWTPQLIDRDYQDLSLWVRNKNASDDFDLTNRDLTLLEGEERLLVEFATSGGNEALSLAWWVEDMNPPTFKA
ncbi:MAG: hypothetical protein ACYSWU_24715, partial [Planctomycetota bacterium]